MTNAFKKKVTTNIKNKDNADRLDSFEQSFNTLVEQINRAFSDVQTKRQQLETVINGIIKVVGQEAVAKAIAEVNNENLEKESQEKQKNLKLALDAGTIVVGTAIGPQSIVVGTERKADSTPLYPTTNIVGFLTLNADLQSTLLGRVKGEVLDIPNTEGNKFEITEVYDVVSQEPTVTSSAE